VIDLAIEKVEGIVIREVNYSESSKILSIFTKEYGIISVISKGCRNIRSKLRGISSRFVYGNFYIHYKENGISTLTEAEVIQSFSKILSDIYKISYASYWLELTEQAYKYSNDIEIYDLLVDCLKKINEGFNEKVLTSILELKLLPFLGIQPVIDQCSVCGNTKDILTISVISGGYICHECYQSGKIYSGKMIKLIRLFFYVDICRITKLDVSDTTMVELDSFISEYYDHYSGLYLKSKEFLKNLNKIS